jgi:large subunit ribosomal protein L16
MLEPKKIKYRRHHRGNRRGMATRGNNVAFGTYGLKALEAGWITARQIEASRIVISRIVRKLGKMWIRIFPDKPVTAKPAETRMGKGKGALDYWVASIKPGRILFEIEGVDRAMAEEAFRNAGHKLPIKTKLVERRVI